MTLEPFEEIELERALQGEWVRQAEISGDTQKIADERAKMRNITLAALKCEVAAGRVGKADPDYVNSKRGG
ncbi:hypothetical protein [Thalassospira tepidiphila]|uniref:Uncharacterized protein n=2 Tax=Thalassospira tepidiphila TaxID=393657 RepID=A0A853KW42_9PROT|nr:hypothetical protein [Thalassospira tepidiphila]NJB74599.1 hypothetical protein [Thalassospira tepidiphila]OAZ08071.1 hypothetical protein TH4_18635 [Thalassospira tepidiphila MCCC 1A03514]